jgi:hypothetical protein
MQNVDQALWLEPSNQGALSLKHRIGERLKAPEPKS